MQLRAMWYVSEVVADGNTDASCVVEVAWLKEVTLFDYDSKVFDRFTVYSQKYLPAKTIAGHICCPPLSILRFVLPVLHALLDRWARSRIQIHNVPEMDIVTALSEYGIHKEMLPTEMGGLVELNIPDWIAYRRSVEMEEL